MQIVSYAQNHEDIILKRLFKDQLSGFYIDIGASHPVELSVTKLFYDKNWCGINVDPIKRSLDMFKEARPRDINLNVGIDSADGVRKIYEIVDYPELTTFSKEHAERLLQAGHQIQSYEVNCISGNKLFEQHVNRTVDFLKIDTEGHEKTVIESIDFTVHRPRAIVVEATIANCQFPGWDNLASIYNHQTWEYLLLESGYNFAYFDGLNRFYVRDEDKSLLQYFQVGLCLWDNFIPNALNDRISELEHECEIRLQSIFSLQKIIDSQALDS